MRAMLLCVAVMTGCAPADIDGTYGRSRGPTGGRSVNGTAVLAQGFKHAGFRVSTWQRLSPRLEEADVIVWVPDDFEPPTLEQRAFLERWLHNESGRTLVYVGRDFDATVQYWRKAQLTAPPEQALEVARRLALAQSNLAALRAALPAEEPADWFIFRGSQSTQRVRQLEGPWSEGIDAARAELELASKLDVPGQADIETWLEREEIFWEGPVEFRPLLTTEGSPLVTQLSLGDWGSSKLLVVTNGSFLLNLPLVNHEHRKLAGRLVAACEPRPGGKAVFLESGAGGPAVLDEDRAANYPTGLEMFTVWPLGIIMLHLAALGITLAIVSFPIFGQPRALEVASRSDFGQHVTAVGKLLEKTGDPGYALARLRDYHDHVRSGASPRGDRLAVPQSIHRTGGS
jgi:hypothetical protein